MAEPVCVGVKVTWMVHVPPPAATPVLQLSVSLNGPLAETLVIDRGALPSLTNVTLFGLLAKLTSWFPKARLCGVKATAGASCGLILAMKALVLELAPAYVDWGAPAITGKFPEAVPPVTYTAPPESTAIAFPKSESLPPRKVEFVRVPEGPNSVKNTSAQGAEPQVSAPVIPKVLCSASARGKLLDCVRPVTKASPDESTAIA